MRRRVGVALFSLMAVLALSLVSAPPAHAQTIRESEPNNTLSQADVLSPNATVCGVSTDSIDYDYFRVKLPADGVLQLKIASDDKPQYLISATWDVVLLDASGEEISIWAYNLWRSGSSADLSEIGLPAGTYYVSVRGKLGKSNYRLTASWRKTSDWEIEYNDTLSTATRLPLNTTFEGSMIDATDVDYYRFSVSKAGPVQVLVTKPITSTGSYWFLQILDSSGSELAFKKLHSTHDSYELVEFPKLSAGTYYVCLSVAQNIYILGNRYSVRVGSGAQLQAMYRLYNQWTGEHFYTASASERDKLKKVGWTYEGTGWVAPTSGDPVYRLYNPYVVGGDHHYTLSANERDQLVGLGWRAEGTGWYSGGFSKVYRQYNPYATTGTHNYTTDEKENDALVQLGWKAEGVGWYAVSS